MARFEVEQNNRRGMTGYLAILYLMSRNTKRVATPKTIRQTTVTELQGYVSPPYPNPSKNMTVAPTIVMVPSQSIATKPSIRGVFGVSTLSKKTINVAARPAIGTANHYT